MVIRIAEFISKPGKTNELRSGILERVFPILKAQPGFLSLCTLVSPDEPRLVLTLTFWRTPEDAQQSGWERLAEPWRLLNPFVDVCQRNLVLESDLWLLPPWEKFSELNQLPKCIAAAGNAMPL